MEYNPIRYWDKFNNLHIFDFYPNKKIKLFIYLFVIYLIIEIYNYKYYIRRKEQLEKIKNLYSTSEENLAKFVNHCNEYFENKNNVIRFLEAHIFDANVKQMSRNMIYLIIKNSCNYNRNFDIHEHKLVENMINNIENKLGFKLSSDNKNSCKYYLLGHHELNTIYKPYFITKTLRIIKKVTDYILWLIGFEKHELNYGIRYWIKNNVDSKKRPILILHGIGMGYLFYMNYILHLSKTRTVIIFEMPNISYSNMVDFYPSLSEIYDTIYDIIKSYSNLDIFGHSYGSVLASYIIKKNPCLFVNKFFLDPICFFSGIPNLINISTCSLWKYTKNSSAIMIDILQYILFFTELETQFLIHRRTQLIDMIYENKYIDDKLFVIIGGNDETLNGMYLKDKLNKYGAKVFFYNDSRHGHSVYKNTIVNDVKKLFDDN